ncbi:MAG: ABC transporter permease [Chlamydiales bacterium]|jgi:spermidine/putrescine transport system permease protein|nr:ABC transporter permease [Chlamydiales bacterium]
MKQKNNLTKVLSLLSIAAVYLFLYVPLIVLLIFSFNTASFPSPWQGFTWNWYIELFQTEHLWQSFLNSLIVAFSATLLSLLMGVFLIFYCSQAGRIRAFLTLFYGNLIIPETVLAVALLGFFTLIKVSLGLGTLVIAHTVLGLGFVIPIVYARFLELDDRMTEASLVLGATPIQTFLRVILPLLRPSLITTGLLVFILSFDDFILSYFCMGSDSQTLSLYILSMLRSGISPIVNALSAILLTLSSFLVFLFFSIKSTTKVF